MKRGTDLLFSFSSSSDDLDDSEERLVIDNCGVTSSSTGTSRTSSCLNFLHYRLFLACCFTKRDIGTAKVDDLTR